jgi:hypothetical protein
MDNVGTGAWVGIVTISVSLSHTAVKIKSELPQEIVIALSSQYIYLSIAISKSAPTVQQLCCR